MSDKATEAQPHVATKLRTEACHFPVSIFEFPISICQLPISISSMESRTQGVVPPRNGGSAHNVIQNQLLRNPKFHIVKLGLRGTARL
jgi:hypothetical protein